MAGTAKHYMNMQWFTFEMGIVAINNVRYVGKYGYSAGTGLSVPGVG